MSEYATWHAFYQSDLQAVWGLCVIPGLFLIYRGWLAIAGHGPQTQGVTPGAIRFVDRYAILFALLFATYGVMLNGTAGGPVPHQVYEIKSAFIETMILLASSFTFGMATLAMNSAVRIFSA